MVFNTLSTAASERNVCIAGAHFFASHSIVKRTNAALFAEHALAFSQDPSLAFRYSPEQVLRTANSVSSSAAPLVVAACVGQRNVPQYSRTHSSAPPWSRGRANRSEARAKGSNPSNQFPIINGAIHFVEAVLVTVALLTGGDEVSALASMVADSRCVVAVVTLVLGAVATGQFLLGLVQVDWTRWAAKD
ncbi:hypothetical protein CcCBS67573_g02014 [Chytriomyces confervae]|uniref:Uncharacterized protein n=1 Tax=Chytriomyces confervae TaxID=246404 RepID=A0A507FM69_9FUNG|nr:hypothetical protein HDU80_008675 [Chytriomyces hyalinus]TPX76725.1 hypothetical protein CcCBS67573_g02014 [Chytriomyces confervae]